MTVASRGVITFDCADARALAAFWADLTGGHIVMSKDTAAAVRTDWISLAFLVVADFRPPRWPEEHTQAHIDLAVEDLDAALSAALQAGAIEAAHQPDPAHRRVLLDPAGHPFCLTTQVPPALLT